MIRNIRFLGLIAMLTLFSGCAIYNARVEEKEITQTNENKERKLERLQGNIDQKKSTNKELLSQLETELQKLEKLINDNRVIDDGNAQRRSDIARQKQRLADFDNRLDQLKTEIAHGSSGQDEAALSEKKRRIEELQADIEAYLEMGNN